jgi:hypothetical protein
VAALQCVDSFLAKALSAWSALISEIFQDRSPLVLRRWGQPPS